MTAPPAPSPNILTSARRNGQGRSLRRNEKEKAYVDIKRSGRCSKKGVGIQLIRVGDVTTLADYFLICTGTSNTHVKTLCDCAEATLEGLGETMLGREGHRGNTWELLDFGCVVIHVFTNEARQFYDLERLWSDGEVIPLSEVLNEQEN